MNWTRARLGASALRGGIALLLIGPQAAARTGGVEGLGTPEVAITIGGGVAGEGAGQPGGRVAERVGAISASVRLGDREFVLELAPASVRSPGYRLLVQGAGGALAEATPGAERTLRGGVVGVPGSIAAGSWLGDGLHALVAFPDGRTYRVDGPMGRAMPGQLVTEALPHGERSAAGIGPCGELVMADLGCDADVEFFLEAGGVGEAEAQISAIINAVNVQYERDAGITHRISTIIVRTAEPDPYPSANGITLLFQFQDEWNTNQGGVRHDLAHLFTGKDLESGAIGLAFVGGSVCEDQAYCLTRPACCTDFGCVTDLSAKQMGYLWGATACACPGFTMGPGLQCSNRFHPTLTVPQIVAHRDSRTCLRCGTCPADFNGDGSVNAHDVLAFLSAYVAGLPGADINRDGAVTVQDFVVFLRLFVAGCG